jgi:hypothetical protein
MLPGLDGIPGSAVLDRLSLLKYRNARGSHIYVRLSGEHRYTALDDLSEISLAKLAVDGFTPCAVVETSYGNFQVWLKHPDILPKLLRVVYKQTPLMKFLLEESLWNHFGFLLGYQGRGELSAHCVLHDFIILRSAQ